MTNSHELTRGVQRGLQHLASLAEAGDVEDIFSWDTAETRRQFRDVLRAAGWINALAANRSKAPEVAIHLTLAQAKSLLSVAEEGLAILREQVEQEGQPERRKLNAASAAVTKLFEAVNQRGHKR